MPTLNCQIEIPEIKTDLGAADKELSVGRKFLLRCEGEWPELQLEKSELRLDPADKYKLQLLQIQKTSQTQGQLLVVSYKVGEHKLKALQLVDAEHAVLLGDLEFTVKSVLSPQEPETEPYGPMGPISFGLPWWYYGVALGFVVGVGLWLWSFFWRRAQKKKLIREMKLSDSALVPLSQLGQQLRQVMRDLNEGTCAAQLEKVDHAFRVYFARRFQVPTLIWKNSLIMKDFKKNHRPIFDLLQTQVLKTWVELGHAKASPQALTVKDLEQLVLLVRQTSEQLELEVTRKESR